MNPSRSSLMFPSLQRRPMAQRLGLWLCFSAWAVSIPLVRGQVTAMEAPALPTVADRAVTRVGSDSVSLVGRISDDGGSPITGRGIVYSVSATNSDPVLLGMGVSKTSAATNGTGTFVAFAEGLEPNTRYAYKAFGTNEAGTGYSSVGFFMTSVGAPTLTTPTSTAITSRSALLGGNLTNTGGMDITERGVVYAVDSSNSDPSLGGDGVTRVVASGTATGEFAVEAADLAPNTTYSFKAYATSGTGSSERTSYTTALTFTTLPVLPLLGSPTSSAVAASSATLGAEITSDNGEPITQRGVLVAPQSINRNPFLAGPGVRSVVVSGVATGRFTASVDGLAPGTTYAFKAYASNRSGTSYTSVSTFTTSAGLPLVGTPTASSIASRWAELGGNVVMANGSPITERGVVYAETSQNADPEIDAPQVMKSVIPGALGLFGRFVAGLTPNTTYSFKAYATNAVGTAYSRVSTFTTAAAAPAMAAKPRSSSVSTTAATLSGRVTSDHGATIRQRGIVYALKAANRNPKLAGEGVLKAVSPGTTGSFAVTVRRLTAGKTYSFRAYAINAKGVSYSSVGTFTTAAAAPLAGAGALPSSLRTETYETADPASGLK